MLPCAVIGALARGMHEASEQQTELSVAPSRTSGKQLGRVVHRLDVEIVKDGIFLHFNNLKQTPSVFKWPKVDKPSSGNKAATTGGTVEDEIQGYSTAVPWLQKHVCPDGIRAVLKYQEGWLTL